MYRSARSLVLTVQKKLNGPAAVKQPKSCRLKEEKREIEMRNSPTRNPKQNKLKTAKFQLEVEKGKNVFAMKRSVSGASNPTRARLIGAR
jgi:hypothetical protein